MIVPLVLALLVGCEGSNLFQGPEVLTPDTVPVVDESDRVLRYVEEGTLLQADEDRLRFRWETDEPLRFTVDAATPERERAAFIRAIELLADASAPVIESVSGEGDIEVRSFPPDDYRRRDATRPWSFSRTFVTASPEEGITEVEIFLSLELSQPVLDRAALHAMGHAMGIMGHPAFPGDRHIMAARPEEGDPIPTALADVEVDAFRFLYSSGVRTGMTLQELRAAFRDWTP